MGAFSIWHWIIVLIIVLLLFGKGKIPTLMGDMAKGIKSFKKNMSDEENASTPDSDNKDSSIQIRISNVFSRLDGDIHHPNHHYCCCRS
jgi:sec-independent protein translocase protein TatA